MTTTQLFDARQFEQVSITLNGRTIQSMPLAQATHAWLSSLRVVIETIQKGQKAEFKVSYDNVTVHACTIIGAATRPNDPRNVCETVTVQDNNGCSSFVLPYDEDAKDFTNASPEDAEGQAQRMIDAACNLIVKIGNA